MADMTDPAFCRVVREVTEGRIGLSGRGVPLERSLRLSELSEGNSSQNQNQNQNQSVAQLAQEGNPSIAQGVTTDRSIPPLVMFREMVSSEAVVRKNDKTLGMVAIHPEERPLVQQIFGSEPETMAEAVRIIEAEDHPEGFDINMGCPVYKIVHNFNGSALMKDPERAAAIVRAMKAATTLPVSVKIRLGWSDPNDCIAFAKVLEDAGADLLTVHGRTKTQGYAGTSDWVQVGKVKQAVNIPVLCNGDVHTADTIADALKISGCDGVLIARGALGNPWIFKQWNAIAEGKEPCIVTIEERIRVVKRHLELHLEQHGPQAVTTFRKHLAWYFKSIPNVKKYRDAMMTAKNREELETVLDSILL